MTQHSTTRSASALYFSAVRLAAHFGGGTRLTSVMYETFGIVVKRSTVAGWIHRDHVPSPIIAQMMCVQPDFPFLKIVAQRKHALTIESLLS